MPNINRIRVNNVKYNFGTQSYDDFFMKMYGRNTLYDLANGGGKSILMLLLMQCVIPNSTLDDKQPIEKLFRGKDNTCIHSLIEWKLDAPDISEGMRYMTTGFAARKAGGGSDDQLVIEGTEEKRDTAEIEYFNYCIFYRDYNRNDIINLPLEKNGERITYKGLRVYLQELAREDKNIIVRLFDRKGEYQRFIAEYGIYESQWELIRGINRTEGHVRTYFETNYKTTRKVVEDLLIEEIIEKAYAAKTEREEKEAYDAAGVLMTIQEELTTLAEKKKMVSNYDREAELIRLLYDRIEGFMAQLLEKEETARGFADIKLTLEEKKKKREEKSALLEERARELSESVESMKKDIEGLKLASLMKDVTVAEERVSIAERHFEAARKLAEGFEEDLSFKEAVEEYFEYIKDLERLSELQEDSAGASDASGRIDTECISWNIRKCLDEKLLTIEKRLGELEDRREILTRDAAEAEKNYTLTLQELAVTESKLSEAKGGRLSAEEKLRTLRGALSKSSFDAPSAIYNAVEAGIATISAKESDIRLGISEEESSLIDAEENIAALSDEKSRKGERLRELIGREEERREKSDKLSKLMSIYGERDADSLLTTLREALDADIIRIYETDNAAAETEKRIQDIEKGRVLRASESIEKVIEYIITRHKKNAMSGMDFIAVQTSERAEELLGRNPLIPYSVVVDGLQDISFDAGLREIDNSDAVLLIDKADIENSAENAASEIDFVIRQAEYFTDEKIKDNLLRLERERLKNLSEQKKSLSEMNRTRVDDLAFVEGFIYEGFGSMDDEIRNLRSALLQLDGKLSDEERRREACISRRDSLISQLSGIESELDVMQKDAEIAETMVRLEAEAESLQKTETALSENHEKIELQVSDIRMRMRSLKQKLEELDSLESSLHDDRKDAEFNWSRKYSLYYTGKQCPDLHMTLSELIRLFDREEAKNQDARLSLEKEKMLRDTLKASVDRIAKGIADRGVSIEELGARYKEGSLYRTDERELQTLRDRTLSERENVSRLLDSLNKEKRNAERLSGGLTYAKQRFEEVYGKLEDDIKYPENPETEISEREEALKEMKEAAKIAAREFQSFRAEAAQDEEIFRYAARVIANDNISDREAVPYSDDADIRKEFDDLLLRYDRISKNIDKQKNDTLKLKERILESLKEAGATELAASVREDVDIPESRRDAENLIQKLKDERELIILEKERIEKSLSGMERLRENFIEQCLERCLDVKTELGKLPHLSEINLGKDTRVEMIRLSIPYVKPEYMKERMGEYIDRLVEGLDGRATGSERQKYLNSMLSLKKLFGVIVTDMNRIRLMLYKRERIVSESRYLKYEEAVGSTGQSQGIYIQFLISVINYISGMYAAGDAGSRTKTLFIDNPFGAAKDIYIWEPIFELLKENHVQLVVPTRGATPEITGRFDVNYILGQQKTSSGQTTVVVNYMSKADTEEMEYLNLDFEQQTFDFL